MHNMAAIRVARRQHKDTCSDADGYDLITVPEVSACGMFVVPDDLCAGCCFTKVDLLRHRAQ